MPAFSAAPAWAAPLLLGAGSLSLGDAPAWAHLAQTLFSVNGLAYAALAAAGLTAAASLSQAAPGSRRLSFRAPLALAASLAGPAFAAPQPGGLALVIAPAHVALALALFGALALNASVRPPARLAWASLGAIALGGLWTGLAAADGAYWRWDPIELVAAAALAQWGLLAHSWASWPGFLRPWAYAAAGFHRTAALASAHHVALQGAAAAQERAALAALARRPLPALSIITLLSLVAAVCAAAGPSLQALGPRPRPASGGWLRLFASTWLLGWALGGGGWVNPSPGWLLASALLWVLRRFAQLGPAWSLHAALGAALLAFLSPAQACAALALSGAFLSAGFLRGAYLRAPHLKPRSLVPNSASVYARRQRHVGP